MKKIIFITGATSGIGEASAEIFAKNNYDLIITGRRNEKLLQLVDKLTNTYKVEVLPRMGQSVARGTGSGCGCVF